MTQWMFAVLFMVFLGASGAFAGSAQTPPPPQEIPVLKGKRVALVVGNEHYTHLQGLPQAGVNAAALVSALRASGFVVRQLSDQDLALLGSALSTFESDLVDAELALFYYSGHIVQIGGRNHLVPVDVEPLAERELGARTIELSRVIQGMDRSKTRLNLVLIDVLGANPFAAAWDQANPGSHSAQGLAPQSAPPGFLIAFGASPGDPGVEPAAWSAALARNLAVPGAEIGQVLESTRQDLIRLSAGAQVPWNLDLRESARFYPAGAPVEKECLASWMEKKSESQARATEEWGYIQPQLVRKDPFTAAAVRKWYDKWGSAGSYVQACGRRESLAIPESRQAAAWLAEWNLQSSIGNAQPVAQTGSSSAPLPTTPLESPDEPLVVHKNLMKYGLIGAGVGAASLGLAYYFKSAYDDAPVRSVGEWYDSANQTTGWVGYGFVGAGALLVFVSFGGE